MPQRARPLVAVALSVGLLLTGCSPGSDASSSSGSSPSSTASTSPSTGSSSAAETPPPAPRPAPGPAGQKAFARHVVDLWGYALRTNDAAPLTALGGPKACGGCVRLSRELAVRKRQGWAVDLTGVDVRRVVVARSRGDVRVARATLDIPASDAFFTDGRFRSTNRAHPGAAFVVRMRYADKRYRLVSFTVA